MKRRSFLKSGAMAAGSVLIPAPLFAQESKIKLAILGTGWWARDFLMPYIISSGQYEIVGLCDVDFKALDQTAEKLTEAGKKKPAFFSSYQEMYKMSGLQAVVIATPTHWHALQFIAACERGLHVFLEKPISYDIREGQAMVAAQRKAGNVVLVDFPRIMLDVNDQVKEYIASGEAGEIKGAKANIISREGPLVEKSIPDTMDFDTYCGPAPMQKYMCPEKGSKPRWRDQFAFSRGVMVDWGIHYIHNVRRVLDLGFPESVSAVGGNNSSFPRENPDQLDVRMEFDGFPVYWSHKTWGYVPPDPEHNIGVFYYGTKATIFAGDIGWRVYPKGAAFIDHGEIRFRPGSPEFKPYLKQMFDGLFREFARGIMAGSNQGITNTLEGAQKTTSSVIFADMAYRSKAQLEIEKTNLDITNHDEARALLKREYRSPYIHPYSG